jgi:hypothetical protein
MALVSFVLIFIWLNLHMSNINNLTPAELLVNQNNQEILEKLTDLSMKLYSNESMTSLVKLSKTNNSTPSILITRLAFQLSSYSDGQTTTTFDDKP